jgi:hypothetical protein
MHSSRELRKMEKPNQRATARVGEFKTNSEVFRRSTSRPRRTKNNSESGLRNKCFSLMEFFLITEMPISAK